MIPWAGNSKKPSVAAGCVAQYKDKGPRAKHHSFSVTGLSPLAEPALGCKIASRGSNWMLFYKTF